jgi:hypothetical protein
VDSPYQDASASVIMSPFSKNIPGVFSAAGHTHRTPAIGMAERASAVALLDARPTTRRIMLDEDKNYDTATFVNALRVRQVPQIAQYMTLWICRQSTINSRVEETFG